MTFMPGADRKFACLQRRWNKEKGSPFGTRGLFLGGVLEPVHAGCVHEITKMEAAGATASRG